MADKKISALDDGGVFQSTDAILIARDGDNFRISGAQVPNVALVANTVERVGAIETEVSGLAAVARSGSYTDLLDKPATVSVTIPSARVWRVYLLPTQDSDQRIYSLSTLAPFGTDGSDLRTSVVAITASSHLIQDVQPVSNLIDNSAATVWSSNDGAFTVAQWIEFEFAQPIAIAEFGFGPRNDNLNLFVRNGYVVTKDTTTGPETRLSNFSFARGSVQANTLPRKPTLTLVSLPAGGVQGQVLSKQSDALGDAIWVDAPTGGDTSASLPTGGTDGQYLSKLGSNDGEAEWRALPTVNSGVVTGARFWRLYPTIGAGNTQVGFDTFDLAPVATGTSTIRASSEEPGGNTATNARPLTTNHWYSAPGSDPNPWIEYEFPNPVMPQTMRIYTASRAPGHPAGFRLEARVSANDPWIVVIPQTAIPSPAATTNYTYNIPELKTGFDFVPEAPINGTSYVRRDGAWVVAAAGDFGALQAEIDAIETGAGLAANGAYAANTTTNYIANATSLKDADNRLDTALKQVSNQVAALGGGGGSSIDVAASIPSARFWRVYFQKTTITTSLYVQLTSLIPFAADGTDLRSSVVAITASSHANEVERSVSNLIDDDSDTLWSSNDRANVETQWVQFEFADPVKITNFGFSVRNAYPELFPGLGYFAAKQTADGAEQALGRFEFVTATVPTYTVVARKPTLTDVLFPLGGKPGQVLSKASPAHGDAAWINLDGEAPFEGARFWRVYLTKAPGSTQVGLAFFGLGGLERQDTPVVASSSENATNWPPASVRPNWSGSWYSAPGTDPMPWIEYQFDRPVTPTELTLYFDHPQTLPAGFRLECRVEDTSEPISVILPTTQTFVTGSDYKFPITAQDFRPRYTEDAPIDDASYVRKNADWERLVFPGLADSGVLAGSYSNPTFTVDAKGRVTSALSGISATANYRGTWSLGFENVTYTFDAQALPGHFSFDRPGASFVPLADNGHAYSLKFPPTPHAATTTLTIPFTAAPGFDTVTVRWRVSSEGADPVTGSIDGVAFFGPQGGERPFTAATRTGLAPGEHGLTITYRKDGSVSVGEDSVFISEITMPRAAEGKIYAYGDTVTHQGNTWYCLKNASLGEPGVSADWLPFLKEPLPREIPPTPSHRGTWSASSITQRTFTFGAKQLPSTWTFSQGQAAFVENHDGTQTAFRFPPTPGNGITTLTIPMFAVAGATTVTIRYATDSEGGFDKLMGYMDGTKFFEGSGGATPYAEATIQVSPGYHVLTLTYSKDGGLDVGADTAYISSLSLPARPDGFTYHYADLVEYQEKTWFCGVENTQTEPGGAISDWKVVGGGSSSAPAPVPVSGGLFPVQPPTLAQMYHRVGMATDVTVGSTFATFRREDGVTGNQSGAFFGQDVPTAATWTMDAIIKQSVFNSTGLIVHGIAVMASDGPLYVLGFDYGTPQITVTRLNSPSSYDSNVRSITIGRTDYMMLRIAKTVSTYQFYFSQDFGNTWVMVHEIQATSFPNANRIGVHSQCYGVYTNNMMVVPYYKVTYEGSEPTPSPGSGGGGALTPYNYKEGAGYNASASSPLSIYLPTDRTITAIVMRLYRPDGVSFDDYNYEVAGRSLNDFFTWANTGTGGRVGGRVTFQILANGNVAVTISGTGGNLMWLEDGPNYVERFESMFVFNS